MRNLLVGNGLNCQFDNKNYTAQQIVLRILKNCNRDDFPGEIIVDRPYLLKAYLGGLFSKVRELLDGQLDKYTVSSAEKEALKAFKMKYSPNSQRLKMTDICFEDYYLLHDLVCHLMKVGNPDQYTIRECMRFAYLFAIYNDGKLNELYLKYSPNVLEYLSSFDHIFTTNYDTNIESATGKQVVHLHGQFDRFSDVYDANSLRNKIKDAPLNDIAVDPNYAYLYCNAITTHSGAYKEWMIYQNSKANKFIENMAEKYKADQEAKKQVDLWLKSNNQLLINLADGIIVKSKNPDLGFSDDYHFDIFKDISGELEILGFSPWNDFHILRTIDESCIEKCTYYYRSQGSRDEIEKLLPTLAKENRLQFKSIHALWGD